MDSTSLTFYTYIYLDPRKPGRYEYGDYAFNFEPFYVGKGNGNRYKEHLKRAFRNNNDQMFFYNKIRKVKDQTGRFPAVQLVEENLTEQEAFELEIWLIWAIGRKYFGGCLTNLSDGGTGTCGTPSWAKGITRSDEYKKKMSERTSGTNAPWYGKRHDEEYKRKMSESLKGPQGSIWTNSDWITQNARFITLHLSHFTSLLGRCEVFMNNADAAFAGHGNCQTTFGHGIHRCRYQWCIE